MKQFLLVFLAFSAGGAAAAEPGSCASPSPSQRRDSSDTSYVGIGGPSGKACPGVELFWLSGDEHAIMCWTAKGAKPISLGAGLAVFSPDCKSFWTATSDGVGLHDAKTGKRRHLLVGDDPAWSADSATIFFSRFKKKKGELIRADAATGKTKTLVTVSDVGPCEAPGEGVVFEPPVLRGERLEWKYPTTPKGKAKKLLVDAKTGKVANTVATEMECN